MNTYEIIVACDTDEGNEFCAWLNANGHTASVGNSTGNYVDRVWTSCDADANEIMNRLWDDYCNA